MGMHVEGELNPQFHVVLRSRMCEALPPFSHTSSQYNGRHMVDISAHYISWCVFETCVWSSE